MARSNSVSSLGSLPPPDVIERRKNCEVYVGNLDVQATEADVRKAFDEHFQQLPAFREQYSDLKTTVVSVCKPSSKLEQGFRFVCFRDETLAATALQLSGLRVGPRSVRVNLGGELEITAKPLDVEPLRLTGRLPLVGGPGAVLNVSLWVGTPRPGIPITKSLVPLLSRAILDLECVKEHLPGMEQPIVDHRLGSKGTTPAFGFVDVACESLASTLVALGSLQLGNGVNVRVGWPSRFSQAARLATLSFAPAASVTAAAGVADNGGRDPAPAAGGSPSKAAAAAPKQSKDFLPALDGSPLGSDTNFGKSEADIWIGGVQNLEASELWGSLEEVFRALPTYRARYPRDHEPVLGLKMSQVDEVTGAASSFAFARLADASLASTAVMLGSVCCGGRRLDLRRPRQFNPSSRGIADPLDICEKVVVALPPQGAPRPRRGPPIQAPPAPPASGRTLIISGLAPLGSESEARELLEEHLLRTSLDQGIVEVEDGPPTSQVLLHRSRRSALVELKDAAVAERLRGALNGSLYLGQLLAVSRPAAPAPPSGGPVAGGEQASSSSEDDMSDGTASTISARSRRSAAETLAKPGMVIIETPLSLNFA